MASVRNFEVISDKLDEDTICSKLIFTPRNTLLLKFTHRLLFQNPVQ